MLPAAESPCTRVTLRKWVPHDDESHSAMPGGEMHVAKSDFDSTREPASVKD